MKGARSTSIRQLPTWLILKFTYRCLMWIPFNLIIYRTIFTRFHHKKNISISCLNFFCLPTWKFVFNSCFKKIYNFLHAHIYLCITILLLKFLVLLCWHWILLQMNLSAPPLLDVTNSGKIFFFHNFFTDKKYEKCGM